MMKRKGYWRVGVMLLALLLVSIPALGQKEKTADEKSRFSIGAGLGIPFGVIGLSLEINPILGAGLDRVSNYYSLNIGLGFAVAKIGYSLGVRFYPMGRDLKWAPKVSLNYGVVAVVDWEYLVRGFSLGVGCQYRLKKKLSLDADIIFIINHFGFEYIDWGDVGRLKVSCGVRWSLD